MCSSDLVVQVGLLSLVNDDKIVAAAVPGWMLLAHMRADVKWLVQISDEVNELSEREGFAKDRL